MHRVIWLVEVYLMLGKGTLRVEDFMGEEDLVGGQWIWPFPLIISWTQFMETGEMAELLGMWIL